VEKTHTHTHTHKKKKNGVTKRLFWEDISISTQSQKGRFDKTSLGYGYD